MGTRFRSGSCVLAILVCVVGICGFGSVSCGENRRPKNVQVAVRAKWEGTPILLEAGYICSFSLELLFCLGNLELMFFWGFLNWVFVCWSCVSFICTKVLFFVFFMFKGTRQKLVICFFEVFWSGFMCFDHVFLLLVKNFPSFLCFFSCFFY